MAEITDRESLQAWLQGRPPEDGVLIAARAALRVFPLLGPILDEDAERRRAAIVLPVCRAMAIASFAGTWPKLAIGNEFASAADSAADSAAYSAADSAADSASAASAAYSAADSAASASASAASAAYSAADSAARSAAESASALSAAASASARSAAYSAISSDANLLEQGTEHASLSATKLWPGTDGTPQAIREAWSALARHLGTQGATEGWQVWIGWYSDRVIGTPSRMELQRDIALIDNKVWEAGPTVANAEIARLIEQHTEPENDDSRERPDPPNSFKPDIRSAIERLSPVDFRPDEERHVMQAIPHGDEATDRRNSVLQRMERSASLEVLSRGCGTLAEDIEKYEINVPPYFPGDLNRYAEEAAKQDDALGGWLKFLGNALIRAHTDPAIHGGLGEYLGPRLDDIVQFHGELMRTYFGGAHPTTQDLDAYQFPDKTDVAALPAKIDEGLAEAAEDRGPDGPPPMEPEAIETLRVETVALRETTQRLTLTSDPDLRAMLAREQRRAIITIGATLSHSYLRAAEWADGAGPKFAFRIAPYAAGALALLARALGFL